MTEPLSAEDAKLVTLARGARGRIGAPEGAALRDEMGRTYSGATVATDSLRLTAAQLAVAQAISSGARGVECVVVVGSDDAPDLAAVRDLGGAGIPVVVCSPDGTIRGQLTP